MHAVIYWRPFKSKNYIEVMSKSQKIKRFDFYDGGKKIQ